MAFATRRDAPAGMGVEVGADADWGVEVASVGCLVLVSACCFMAPATREWAPVGTMGTPLDV